MSAPYKLIILGIVLTITHNIQARQRDRDDLAKAVKKLENIAKSIDTPSEVKKFGHMKKRRPGKTKLSYNHRHDQENNLLSLKNFNIYVNDEKHGKNLPNNDRSDNEEVQFILVKNLKQAVDQLKCVGGQCGESENSGLEIKKLKCNNGRCEVVDGDDTKIRLQVVADEHHDEDNLNVLDSLAGIGKKIRINDNLDVLVVDKSDLNALLNPEQVSKTERIEKTNLTPDELFQFYKKIKNEILNTAANYVTNVVGSSEINFLPENKVNKLRYIKKSIFTEGGVIEDDKLKRLLSKVIFDDNSFDVQPLTDGSNKILVPQWLYSAALTDKQVLRVKLPKSKQQWKKKLVKLKKLKAHSRPRRSLDENLKGYSFELDIQGLGQLNPDD